MFNNKLLTIITLDEPDILDFAAKRNDLLTRAVTDWVLFLDKDEVLSTELEQEINQAILSNKYDAYYLKRVDTFMGRVLKHGETGNKLFIRLGKKNYGKWVRPVHELWEGRGNPSRKNDLIGVLQSPIIHTPHPTLKEFLNKINKYSDIDSQYRFEQGRRATLLHLWLYPLAKFKVNYFLKLGFLDGIPGLIHALMMSFHSYLTWSKLYLLCKKH